MSDQDGFLSRWARRKQAIAEGRAAPDPVPEPPAPEPEPEPETRTDEEILADLGLPDPDTLGPDDDARGFLAAAVPEHLRRRALRSLWRSDPVLANLDQLVDYGLDYTDKAMVVANMQTAYRVGHGLIDKDEAAAEEIRRAEARAEARAAGEAETARKAEADRAEDEAAEAEWEEHGDAPRPAADDPALADADSPRPAPPQPAEPARRGRIRFHLPEGGDPA